jgi:hypothetical protein
MRNGTLNPHPGTCVSKFFLFGIFRPLLSYAINIPPISGHKNLVKPIGDYTND